MYTINISKAGKSLSVDFNSFSPEVQAHIIEYGLRQKLNDAGSSAIKKDLGAEEAGKQAFAMAEAVLASLKAGRFTAKRGASQKADRFTIKGLQDIFFAVFKRKLDKELSFDDAVTKIIEARNTTEGKVLSAIEERAQVHIQKYEEEKRLKLSIPEINMDF